MLPWIHRDLQSVEYLCVNQLKKMELGREKKNRGTWREGRRREKERREDRESDMVWWVYGRVYMCHLISGALVVLDVLHWR